MSGSRRVVAVQDQESSDKKARPESKKLALAGNPNVGKSALFNALTGLNADVSNYPGTTIDISRGKLGSHDLADTPGIYGVSSFNDEERIARKMLLDADVIINVVSALSLERDLFLTLQLVDMGKPLALVVNQWDEADARGIQIDLSTLEKHLGVPVASTVAVTGKGLEDIPVLISRARQGTPHHEVAAMVDELGRPDLRREHALLLLEGDRETSCELGFGLELEHKRQEIYSKRRERTNSIVDAVVQQPGGGKRFSAKLGKLLLHPVAGSIAALAVCYLMFYQLLGVFVAGDVVNITEKEGMRVYYEPFVKRTAARVFPSTIKIKDQTFAFPTGTGSEVREQERLDSALKGAKPDDVTYDFWSYRNIMAVAGNTLVGEYGILTLTVTYLIGLLLPLVVAFYLGLSILEDSGYLPRLAVLVDRLLNKLGLTGRAIIPLILGLGCVTMATVTTRLLSSNREKIIATALLGVAIPCSAQLGIVSGTLARAGGLAPWAIYGVIVTGILVGTGLLLNKILPGKSGALMIDLPPMRLPRLKNVLKKTWSKSWSFMVESIPMFALAGLVVSAADMSGLLAVFVRTLEPITVGLLHLPADPRIPTTFILGIVRRDFAAFGLADVALTQAQAVVAMVVITLFVPCIATVGVMIKERGLPTAMTIWAGSWAAAFIIGGALAQVLPVLLPVLKF